MEIHTPELWKARCVVRGFFTRASNYIQDQNIKLQAGINRKFQGHM